MAANLARAGFPLTAWNRTAGRSHELEALGVAVASTPAALASRRRHRAGLRLRHAGRRGRPLRRGRRRGGCRRRNARHRLLHDRSRRRPGDSPPASRSAGIAFVDAPVTGGSEGARNATLAILVGGALADVERARPVLAAIGRTITHFGPVGAGQAAKAVNQVILAGTYLGVAEGLVLALKAGLDPGQVVDALSGGAAQSWVLANRSGRMLANEYPLGFKVALHLKDLGIALALARESGAVLPVAALAAQLEAGLVATGHADDDMSALARAIRGLSGLEA